MGKELLLEIGTEEIPAAFIPKALEDMAELAGKALSGRRIAHGAVTVLGTPRRLCLVVADVAEQQEDQVVERLGPAVRTAFDRKGNPTRAALGFANSQGMSVADLVRTTTDKGEYLCARKHVTGAPTAGLLPGVLASLIGDIPFRKSMRWSDFAFRFARPIHWIVALFGGEVVPFAIENVGSGNASRGHRFLRPEAFTVADSRDYLLKAREHFVIVDPAERREIILREAKRAAAAVGGEPLLQEDLLETVAFLVEYPVLVCGGFAPEFLALPRDVPITAMMTHQKYFPVVDREQNLLPHFLAVSNTLVRNPDVVRKGNERVLQARLSDARFFFVEDQKKPLDQRVADLQKVTFHSQLGTSYEKVLRFRLLAGWIARRIAPALEAVVERAAWLAKADLDTQMVNEFTELQGVMGQAYAALAGEDPAVCRAIYEHYLPRAAGGLLPETDAGAIVSIADKTDTIAGFFGIGLAPSGTADPYALRRQALGVLHILLQKAYPLRLNDLLDESLRILGDRLQRPAADTKTEVLEFFRGRFENHLLAQGFPYDVVDAVLATGMADPVRALRRVEAMTTFKSQPDFSPVAVAFKRVGNIIKGFAGGVAEPDLFQTEEERRLHAALAATKQKVASLAEAGEYPACLTELARLRPPVDAFFEGVLVMAQDPAIRRNRQALLWEVSRLFRDLADFSKIVTEGAAADLS